MKFLKAKCLSHFNYKLPVLIAISSHLSFHSQNVNISSLPWVKSEIHYLVYEKVETKKQLNIKQTNKKSKHYIDKIF